MSTDISPKRDKIARNISQSHYIRMFMDTEIHLSGEVPPQEPTLKERAAKGLFWGGISNFVQQIIGAAFGIFIMRVLGPYNYGLIGMLLIFSAVANSLMDSGFTVALVNKKEIKHEDYNAVFWFSIMLGIILYIILFFSAPLIAKYYDNPIFTDLSRLLFLSFLINSMGFAHNAILIKKLMVKQRAKIDIISMSVSQSVGLIMALGGFLYWGLAIQAILMSLISVFMRWRYAPWKPTILNIDFKPLKYMIGFSSKLLITNIFIQVSSYFLNVIIGKKYGATQAGYYSRGQYWMQLANTTINGMISSVAQPVLVEVNTDSGRQLQIFRKMLRFGAFISFPAMFGLAFISREFILLTLGEDWIATIPILQIFCIYGGFSFMAHLYYQFLLSHGKSNLVLLYYLFFFVLTIVITIVTAGYNMLLTVIAYNLLCMIGIVAWHYFAGKLIGLNIVTLIKDIIPYFGIAIGCIGIAWIVTIPMENLIFILISKILIVASLYLSIVWFSGSTILKESILFLTKRLKKNYKG